MNGYEKRESQRRCEGCEGKTRYREGRCSTRRNSQEAPKEDLRIVDTFIVKERTTTVTPMVDLNRVFIGGKYYNFKKGVDQKVPLDVERVLRERDLIK